MTYDDFLPMVAPYVGSCPEPIMEQHILKAARDFCGKTLCWKEVLDPIEANGASTDFLIPLPDDVSVIKLLRAYVGRAYEFEIVDPLHGRRLSRGGSRGDWIFTPDRRRVTLSFAPQAGAQLTLEAALRPSLQSFEFPDQLFEDYGSDIAEGAKATLLAMPGVDWQNPKAAADAGLQYEMKVSRVKVTNSLGHGATRPRVKAFFR